MINFFLIIISSFFVTTQVEARQISRKSISDFVQLYPQTKWIKCTQNYAFDYPPFPLYEEYKDQYFPNKGNHSDISIVEVPNAVAYIDNGGHVFVNDVFLKETQIKTLEPFQGNEYIQRPDLDYIPKASGRVAIVTHLYPYNYGLFILEMLTVLALLEIHNVEYDYLWIPYGTEWIQEVLDIWGIDRAKIIPLYLGNAITADTIILPTSVTQNDVLVFNVNYHPDFLIKYVREKMLDGFKKRTVTMDLPERIFISRKDARRFALNEDDIFALFEPLGYKRYELVSLTVTEKIALFFNAKKIVSFMGSGSANILFTQPGCHYFEVMHEFVEASYFYICQTIGLQYTSINASTYNDLVHGQVWNVGRALPLDLFENFIQDHAFEL